MSWKSGAVKCSSPMAVLRTIQKSAPQKLPNHTASTTSPGSKGTKPNTARDNATTAPTASRASSPDFFRG
jgi:hypothetical protein